MENPFKVLDARLSNIESLLIDIKHPPKENNTNQEVLLTRTETCEFLQINSSTLFHWTNKGKVTAYGIANRRYYKKAELLECLTPLKK